MKLKLTQLTLGTATLLLLTHTASAADLIVSDNPAQRSAEGLQSATAPSKWTLGIGAGYVPRYEGSNEHWVRALPILAYRNGRFAAGVGGLTYNLSSHSALEFGPLLSYGRGRREDDANHLRGLGNIDGSVDAGIFVRWRLSAWSVYANVKHGVGSGPEGIQAHLGVNHASRLGEADRLLIGASLDWADDKYTRAFFGVSAAQSAASGLPIYAAGAGLKNYGVNTTWVHSFTPAWFSTVGVYAKRLAGDAVDSPITQQRNLVGASAAIGYRF